MNERLKLRVGASNLLHPKEDALRDVIGSGWHLRGLNLALIITKNDVGERSTDVHRKSKTAKSYWTNHWCYATLGTPHSAVKPTVKGTLMVTAVRHPPHPATSPGHGLHRPNHAA
jgi:hypothetical protein